MNIDIKTTILALLCTVLFTTASCGDETLVDTIPQIKSIDVEPKTVVQFQETITLYIEYEDGDGNLGFQNPDEPAVFVKDSRLTAYDGFHIPPISPPGSELAIRGVLPITLPNTFLLGNGDEEVIDYEVYIIDQSGNESNKVKTPKITILRE